MAIRVAVVKSSSLSDDQKEILLAVTGKYTGDLELRFSRECVDDAIAALSRARNLLEPKAAPVVQPSLAAAAPKDNGAERGSESDQVRFEVPKNFTITADTSGRGLVLFIFNHRLEGQRGYALSPDAARQVAGGLIKSADALPASRQPMPPKN